MWKDAIKAERKRKEEERRHKERRKLYARETERINCPGKCSPRKKYGW